MPFFEPRDLRLWLQCLWVVEERDAFVHFLPIVTTAPEVVPHDDCRALSPPIRLSAWRAGPEKSNPHRWSLPKDRAERRA
jgi:hypothetical protein